VRKFSIVFFLPVILFSSTVIHGRVIGGSGEAIEGENVFLEGTDKSDSSNQ
jgi:hypothetical protein